jgi:hypothetical protein
VHKLSGRGLAAIRATAARHDLEALNLIPEVLVVSGVGQEDKPVGAGVGVMVLAGSPWTEYARLLGVHSFYSFLWARLRGVASTCGATSLSDAIIIPISPLLSTYLGTNLVRFGI